MIRSSVACLALGGMVGLLVACSNGTRGNEGVRVAESHGESHDGPHAEPAAKESHAPHWSYAGAQGPEMWDALSPDFEACGRGTQQSPINITGGVDAETPEIAFDYHPEVVRFVNNGHTIQENFDGTCTIQLGEHSYNLVQFHFHTPSEHQVDGRSFPLEAHFVHKDADGHLAVVGVLFEEGEENPVLDVLEAYMPTAAGQSRTVDGLSIDPISLIPFDHRYVTYPGSLTTPPCSEGVHWLVLDAHQTASKEQIAVIHDIIGDNARPVQPANDRQVLAHH